MEDMNKRLLIIHETLKNVSKEELMSLLKEAHELSRNQLSSSLEAIKKLPEAISFRILSQPGEYHTHELASFIMEVREHKPGLLVYSINQPTLIRKSTFEKYTKQVQELIDYSRIHHHTKIREHTLLGFLRIYSIQQEENGMDSCFSLEADCGEYPINQDNDTGLVYDRVCTNSQNFDLLIKTCMLALKILVPECQIHCTAGVAYHELPPAETDWEPAAQLYYDLIGPFHLSKGPWGMEIGYHHNKYHCYK